MQDEKNTLENYSAVFVGGKKVSLVIVQAFEQINS